MSIMPGGFDNHPPEVRVAGFGDHAAPDLAGI
jgi:hypothetical protein